MDMELQSIDLRFSPSTHAVVNGLSFSLAAWQALARHRVSLVETFGKGQVDSAVNATGKLLDDEFESALRADRPAMPVMCEQRKVVACALGLELQRWEYLAHGGRFSGEVAVARLMAEAAVAASIEAAPQSAWPAERHLVAA